MKTNEMKKLMLIDDEPAMLLLVAEFLKNKYQVSAFSNGVEAMKSMAIVQPDLLIVDLNMDSMNGLSIIEAIRQNEFYKHLPIMVLSGDDKSQSRIKALRTGADDYMVKPFNPEELEVRLEVISRRMIHA